jgi:hypothetical protein
LFTARLSGAGKEPTISSRKLNHSWGIAPYSGFIDSLGPCALAIFPNCDSIPSLVPGILPRTNPPCYQGFNLRAEVIEARSDFWVAAGPVVVELQPSSDKRECHRQTDDDAPHRIHSCVTRWTGSVGVPSLAVSPAAATTTAVAISPASRASITRVFITFPASRRNVLQSGVS